MPKNKSLTSGKNAGRLVALSLAAAMTVTSLGLGGAPAFAATTNNTSSESALKEFRSSLVEGAQTDPTVVADIERFDSLSAAQRDELANYLTGELDTITPISQAEVPDGRSTTITQGDFSWMTVEKPDGGLSLDVMDPAAGKGMLSTTASSTVKSIWATQYFTFAGIKISETKVSGSYTARSGKATSIRSHTCNVVRNYDPFSGVSTSKSSSYVSSGKAVFECLVSVKRGIPTPWGHISYSTRENVQYARGTGTGRVDAHGWR